MDVIGGRRAFVRQWIPPPPPPPNTIAKWINGAIRFVGPPHFLLTKCKEMLIYHMGVANIVEILFPFFVLISFYWDSAFMSAKCSTNIPRMQRLAEKNVPLNWKIATDGWQVSVNSFQSDIDESLSMNVPESIQALLMVRGILRDLNETLLLILLRDLFNPNPLTIITDTFTYQETLEMLIRKAQWIFHGPSRILQDHPMTSIPPISNDWRKCWTCFRKESLDRGRCIMQCLKNPWPIFATVSQSNYYESQMNPQGFPRFSTSKIFPE